MSALVNVPARARRRPICPRRHIPIPFVTKIPADGSPVKFAIEDRKRVERCGYQRLCQLCGLRLTHPIVFVGGPVATEQRLFRQAPFHEPCAHYAVATCPYLRNTDDPQFATFCVDFKMAPAEFPLTVPGQVTSMLAFFARGVIRVEPVGRWAQPIA